MGTELELALELELELELELYLVVARIFPVGMLLSLADAMRTEGRCRWEREKKREQSGTAAAR